MSDDEGGLPDINVLERMWKEDILKSNEAYDASYAWWDRLQEQFADSKGRKYYNKDFLLNKARWFFKIKNELQDPTAFACALVFQYFHYEPQSDDWHGKNVDEFKQFAANIHLDEDQIKKTIELLDASLTSCTEEHIKEGAYGSDDVHYFLDMDMLNLGAKGQLYQAFSDKMRQEYSFLRPDLYNNLRLKILQTFLQIPNIYATLMFRDQFEELARKNICEEVSYLQDHPDSLGFKEDAFCDGKGKKD